MINIYVIKMIINLKLLYMDTREKIYAGQRILQVEELDLMNKGKLYLLQLYIAKNRLSIKAQMLMVKLSKERLFQDYIILHELAPIVQVEIVEIDILICLGCLLNTIIFVFLRKKC